ncbi:MAG: hypothetical protein KOO63_03935 [Bacteroidales bacterium]|nr:hypothetical protein [Candidatus Latescibacterota bacterium]
MNIEKLHSKAKGNVGEAAVTKWLLERGYAVFTELGDLSRIDLIAEREGRLYKIQVKAARTRDGIVNLERRKRGPSYRFVYNAEDVDWFGVYVYDLDVVLWVKSEELCSHKASMHIRFVPPRNGVKTGFHMHTDYIRDSL